MMVGSLRGRGVVLSATYEARRLGVRSAMPVAAAQSLCPDIFVIEPDMPAYSDASTEVMRIFRETTPRVEKLSIDEAFLDVGGLRRIAGRPGEIAQRLRERIRAELSISCTIGVASSKFLAKLASTLAKPDGLLIVPPDQALAVLHPLPVEFLWGIGPKTAVGFRRLGVTTIGDVARLDRATLNSIVGSATAAKLADLAMAHDPRHVEEPGIPASIGVDETFAVDVTDRTELERTLLRLSVRVVGRLRTDGRLARGLTLRVRYSDFATVTRSHTFTDPTDGGRAVHRAAIELLRRLDPAQPIRLLGIRLDHLRPSAAPDGQLSFAETGPQSDDDRGAAGWRRAELVADLVTARFGANSLRPASLLAAAPVDGARLAPPARPSANTAIRAAESATDRTAGSKGVIQTQLHECG